MSSVLENYGLQLYVQISVYGKWCIQALISHQRNGQD